MSSPEAKPRGLSALASPTVQGMALMAGSTLAFVCMHTLIRHVARELPPFEVAFFRNLFGLVTLLPLFARTGFAGLRTSCIHLHALRGFIQAFSMLAFFTAVTMVPLAQVTALSFSAPVFATLLAILLLRETVRIRRITALACGFLGMLLVVRPGFAEVGLGTILALFSSVMWGAAITIIKKMARTESSVTQTIYMGLFLTPITFVAALFVWEWPTLAQLALMGAIGMFGTVGHLGFAQAMTKAEASAVLPLDFTRLVWASVFGFVFFAEHPDPWAWVGGSVIFASATYIAWREARLARTRS